MKQLVLVLVMLSMASCKMSDDEKDVLIAEPNMKCHKEYFEGDRAIRFVCEGTYTSCTVYNGTMEMSCIINISEEEVEKRQ